MAELRRHTAPVALSLHRPSLVTAEPRSTVRIPVSTYRLQFNSHFTFRDAGVVTGYLHALGISDCYASSYLMAVPDSPHGYDVADPTRLNPDLGTADDYWAWIAELRSHGMGHVLDLVPNHMGIAKSANPWWLDVLENGPSSRFARFFDIEWHPVKDELADKVLLPILEDQYGVVLEQQRLQLAYHDGAFQVRYGDDVLPIAPDTFGQVLGLRLADMAERSRRRGAGIAGQGDAEELQSILTASGNLPPRSTRDDDQIAVRAREKEIVKRRLAALVERSPAVAALIASTTAAFNGVAGDPRSFDRLDRLLNAQSYRLAHWRVASEEINYRRFFDVNELAALRMEDPVVFEEVHRFVFELVDRGAATGLRVDHVDGLYAPAEYLRRLGGREPFAVSAAPGCLVRRNCKRLPTPGCTSSSRRFSGRANSCRPTGRCTARRATSSPPSSTTCSSTVAASARSTISTRGFCANGASGCRSRISPTAARSRCCTRPCPATSTRWATSSIASPSATATSAISRCTASSRR